MNSLENRLRDAYHSAADTVRPEAIRDLDGQAMRRAGPGGPKAGRRARVMMPLAAAASVSAIAILAAVVLPQSLARHGQDRKGQNGQSAVQHRRGSQPGVADPASPYPAFFVALSMNGTSLSVRSATTGAQVAQVSPPQQGLSFAGLGSGNGHTFVAAVQRSGVCRTRLYQFRLNGHGQPTALAPLAGPEIMGVLAAGTIAVSASGQTIAYNMQQCSGTFPAAYLTVVNLDTGLTRRWTTPNQADIGSLSLTADGHLLAYNIQLTKLFASVARILPTDAAPGPAAERGRTVARATQFGSSTDISADVISAGGSNLFFTTNATGPALVQNIAGQLRVADLGTGRFHVVAAFAGLPFNVLADPSGRYVLLQTELGSAFGTPRLARLDTATGKLTQLQAAWMGADNAVPIAW